MKLRLLLISTIAVILIAFPLFPVYSEFQTPSNKPTNAAIPIVYARSASRVSATPGNMYTPVTASTNLAIATNATIFLSVGTFIPAGQCCFGGYLIGYSIDSRTFIGICGLKPHVSPTYQSQTLASHARRFQLAPTHWDWLSTTLM